MTESSEWTDWIPDVERIKRMQSDIDALKCELVELVEALRPFADISDCDIGESEDDCDMFRPLSKSHAQPILIGHLRRAATLLSRYGR